MCGGEKIRSLEVPSDTNGVLSVSGVTIQFATGLNSWTPGFHSTPAWNLGVTR
ncbi:hypothetical protein OP10G_0420 [Fimbriimonas ginsengisoli Gsoil 348]|uniref:Uncharacterized protein n=1 Tax=Fimbriimonas ginsengisoli Gsoil 348 TaxID=661478 RepID=A0A068NJJ3_FIMGI|nr:hypothetical protein OP10G_0420 [Fimbriimonas ginsengisoli Gsoil 348]